MLGNKVTACSYEEGGAWLPPSAAGEMKGGDERGISAEAVSTRRKTRGLCPGLAVNQSPPARGEKGREKERLNKCEGGRGGEENGLAVAAAAAAPVHLLAPPSSLREHVTDLQGEACVCVTAKTFLRPPLTPPAPPPPHEEDARIPD